MKSFAGELLVVVLALACVGCAISASVPISAPSIDALEKTEWTRGRMTFYGKDGYSIHDGACHYGGIPYPYYVAALSDWWPEYINSAYEHNKCGHCFEIQCDPNGRSYCRNDRVNASIIVKVTDRCPCKHENPSNKRWCCGDMPHFDVSHEAFGELASHTGGWVYLQWREIQCPDAVGLGGDLLEDPLNWSPYCDADSDKTLADVAQDNGMTTFLEAAWRAGPEVWDILSTKAHTNDIIAPTNAAFENFAKLVGLTVDELLDAPSLPDIIKGHVLAATDSGYVNGNVNVTELAFQDACNGKIHASDEVAFSLCEEGDGVLEVAEKAGLHHFAQAMWKAGIAEVNSQLGVYTLLAPTDGAFQSAIKKLKFSNFSEFLDSPKLGDIMRNHIVTGKKTLGHRDEVCHDLAVPNIPALTDILPLMSNSSSCNELAQIGFCANEWVAEGYCRETCGRCSTEGAKLTTLGRELTLSKSKIKAEDQLRVYSHLHENPHNNNVVRMIEESQVLAPDVEACNGFVNIIDSVII